MSPLAVVGALLVGGGLAALAAIALPPPAPLAPRVRPYTVVSRSRLGRLPDPVRDAGEVRGVFLPLIVAAARRASRLFEARSDEHVALRLAQAGAPDSTDAYRIRMAVAGVVGAVAGVLLGTMLGSPGLAVVLSGAGFTAGAARVRGALDRAIASRAQQIRHELATVNQLLAIHLRTGAGPVQAVQRVVDRGRGAVVEELSDALTLTRHGVREGDAFRRIAARTPEPAAARTYLLFATGAERGADLADGLLALAEDLRDARREQLRQAAVRRRAAMLAPTIGILAPIMLLFIAAPLPSLVFGAR